MPKVKVTVDPDFGVIQEPGEPAFIVSDVVPVTLGGTNVTIGYSPEDPSQWSSLPTTLIQAVDYLAAGSGSGGGGGGGGVTSVGATSPIASSGGATPTISISAATTLADGSMSAADKLKLDGIATGASIAGTIAANEVAFGTGVDSISGSASLTYNPSTQDFVVGDGAPHSIRIGPTGYVGNPIIESLDSMNINIANFGGTLAFQAANNDLIFIGGDDGAGQSYLQTQPNVRLETQGRLLVKPATDGADGVEVRNSTNVLLVQIDTSAKTTTLTGDTNSVLTLVDEIAAAPFFTATPVTRELALTDPVSLTDTTLITPTDVAVNNGSQTGNLSGGQVRVTDTGTTNTLAMSIPGGLATLGAADGTGTPVELHVSASTLTMESQISTGNFLTADSSNQRLTVVDPGTGVDSVYLEGGRITIDAAGNTVAFDAFVNPTITTLNVGSSLPMPLNLAIEALQINSDPGSAGYVLVSSGSGYSPVWAAAPYSAAVSADWSGSPPVTIAEALDRIAAALGPIA